MQTQSDNLITWLIVLGALLVICAWGGASLDFQKRCDARCGVDRASTPFMNFKEVCLCDEGHGRWRREIP